MTRHVLRFAIAIWIMSTSILGIAESQATLVRVLDKSEVQGIAGVILLVNPGVPYKSQAFITDSEGRASVPHLDCTICTITAMDPRGLFFSKTTEFDGRSLSITLVLEVKPVIDIVFVPGSVRVNVAVYGPSGEPLSHQRVVVRPTVMTLDTNWRYLITTDSKGMISPELLPGEYTVATLLGDKPWEAPLRVTKSKCAKKVRKCNDSLLGASNPRQPITVHLSAASANSQ